MLALINSCYGADFLSFPFGDDATRTPLPAREGAHAITAGSTGELTWSDQNFGDGDGRKGSIFFEAVLAALDGRADRLPEDGIVSVGELETYIRSTISTFTKERQNPSGGDLMSTRSPGGFFFLDRNRQIENGNATPLDGEWWGGVSFGDAAPPPPIEVDTSGDVASRPLDPFDSDAEVLEPMPEIPPLAPPLAQLAGNWTGVATEPNGFRYTVEVEFGSNCDYDAGPCGGIAVPHVPCRGKISLENIRDDGFEFNVSDFDASSDTSICQPGAGEVFKALPDGTLAYTATYSGAVGILRRTN